MSESKTETTEPNIFGCSHLKLITYSNKQFCHYCGVFRNNVNIKVYRTPKLKYGTFFNPMKILEKALLPCTYAYEFSFNTYYKNERNKVIEFMIQAANNLLLSKSSVFLAVIYLDRTIQQQEIAEQKLYLFASTALMLAAKSTEIDQNIPFISQIKKSIQTLQHPEINYFSTLQFRQAEIVIIKTFDWNLQVISLLDRVQYILAMGVLDEDDSIVEQDQVVSVKSSLEVDDVKKSSRNKKLKELEEINILKIVQSIEDTYQEVCLKVLQGTEILQIKEQIYFQGDQVLLALAVVGYLRKKSGLMNVWSHHLQSLTDISAQNISGIVSQLMVGIRNEQQRLNYWNISQIKESKTSRNISTSFSTTTLSRTSQLLQTSSQICQPFKSKGIKKHTYLNENSSIGPPTFLQEKVKLNQFNKFNDLLFIKSTNRLNFI